jgi:hypothetical protein
MVYISHGIKSVGARMMSTANPDLVKDVAIANSAKQSRQEMIRTTNGMGNGDE